MGKSIITDDMKHCIVFGCENPVCEEHHVVHGTANRKVSDKRGLVIPLCREHHSEIHRERKMDLYYKQIAQNAYETKYGSREQFIKEFGKSYL